MRKPLHRWSPHLRGHLLLFDGRPAPACAPHVGVRLLLAAALVEILRRAALGWLHPPIPLVLLMAVLLGFGLLAVPSAAGIGLSHLGFRPWRDWTATEKSYLLQVVAIANVVFPLVFAGPLAIRIEQAGIGTILWTVFVPYLLFGFYQEIVYRGMVQVELVRRWGAPMGIVVANVLYTFGPLHWNYFASPASLAVPMFAAIFLIGLFFGVVYRRSGNLGMVATFHAIGNAYIVAAMGPLGPLH